MEFRIIDSKISSVEQLEVPKQKGIILHNVHQEDYQIILKAGENFLAGLSHFIKINNEVVDIVKIELMMDFPSTYCLTVLRQPGGGYKHDALTIVHPCDNKGKLFEDILKPQNDLIDGYVCGFDAKFLQPTFSSGAKTDDIKPAYNLIPLDVLKREAKAWKIGADHYGENNWQKAKGDDKFIKERANHLIEHIFLWLSGDRQEDHLANVRCNAGILMKLTEGK